MLSSLIFLKFWRVTIRGAQPSARLSEETCLSEGSAGVSQKALWGSLRGFCGALWGSAGVRGIFRGFSGVVTCACDPRELLDFLRIAPLISSENGVSMLVGKRPRSYS